MSHHVRSKLKLCAVIVSILVTALAFPVGKHSLVTHAASQSGSLASIGVITGAPQTSNCVVYEGEGAADCRSALPEEAAAIAARESTEELRVITPPRLQSGDGLQIILRATPQLDAQPAAKAAFLRAADVWASRVQTPTTVIVDVDFGPTWFGRSFPEGVVGMTNPQMLIGFGQYPFIMLGLMFSASSEQESALYNALPQPTVPTDLGEVSDILAPSAVYRTLGLIGSDPANDPSHFGLAPAIGFNSSMSFDFDSSDGIEPGKYDFEAVASHEIGHVLGFVSAVGQHETNPASDVAATVWDLYRLRPGASMDGFSTAPRILSSGGAQVFFAGSGELQLSTGKPDGTAGEGFQPSHWRDDSIVGQRIGIMDPTIPSGKRQTITINDLNTLDFIGYRIRPFGNNRPTISSLAADLNGDVLTLTGVGTDLDGDVVSAQAQFLDDKDRSVAQTAPFSPDFGVTTSLALRLSFNGMGGLAEATQISLVLIDSRGNRSAAAIADFSAGDPDAPKVSSATYTDGTLKIKGKRLTGDLKLEVNGVIVVPPASINAATGKKLIVSGSATSLNLRGGPNRIRVISGTLRSNLLVASL